MIPITLDVPSEVAVFEVLQYRDREARTREVMIMPSVGFFVAASDCLNQTTEDWYTRFVTLSATKGLSERFFALLRMTRVRDHIVKCTNVMWFDLAVHAAKPLPNAHSLRLGISRTDVFSRGSRKTMIELAHKKVMIRRGGKLTPIPLGVFEHQFNYGDGVFRTDLVVSRATLLPPAGLRCQTLQ